MEATNGKNLYWASPTLRATPTQLEVSYYYGRKHKGPGVKAEDVDNFDALYLLTRRHIKRNGDICEVFSLDSFIDDVNGYWMDKRFGDHLV